MKKLSELYPGCGSDVQVGGICINSRYCQPGDLFVCVQGVTADRHDFVEDAVKNGAAAIVAGRKIDVNVPVIYVEDVNRELTEVAKRLYDYPEQELKITAVTGTNGKTTVASCIARMIGDDMCGLMGTNGVHCSGFDEQMRNTCPDADRLYGLFRRIADAGCRYVSMEASSEALAADRLRGIQFHTVIFTNITEDHLNTHKTIENYVKAKLKLLGLLKEDGAAILNIDDQYFIRERTQGDYETLTYGMLPGADLRIMSCYGVGRKTAITYLFRGEAYHVISPLSGLFNVYNLSAAILALYRYGYSMQDIMQRVSRIGVIPGRVEYLSFGQNFDVVLDYAHTEDAFRKLYDMLRQNRKGRIITVTGAAGGRETEKRSVIGRLVLEQSDLAVFTMDDPRRESVDAIIDELVSKTDRTNYIRVINRRDAIHTALSMARENDVVVVAGKGRDNYMALGDQYLPWSDYDIIEEYFQNKGSSDSADHTRTA